MTALPSVQDVKRFRDLIAARLGLGFDETRLGNLAKLLLARGGADCGVYLDALAQTGDAAELARLAPELTVTETYFFRSIDQINAYAAVALPQRLAAGDGARPLRVLSAGCASGEEPYSLAIAALELAGLSPNRIALTALDLNPLMLAKAARARYTPWSLREFPAELKGRWFRPDGDAFVLEESIRRMVRFEARNLADEGADFWLPGSFDVIFCRNVLMYFTPAQAQAAVARIARALAPGGYFFLGHAETLRGVSNDFHLCHSHGAFYSQRKGGAVEAPAGAACAAAARAWAPEPPADTGWVDAIGRAARRIDVLASGGATATASPTASAGAGAPAAGPGPDLAQARELLHNERYAQSLEQIGALPREHADDPDVLLLKAVSLSHSGSLAAAEAVCRQLLALDELNAGAHYVLALCSEGAGDVAGALGHNQSAAYLDPDFAMPRLHIGLLERRQGEREAARRDLALALQLLQKEDPARLLLFGGGFKRDALLALCRAELAAFGEGA